MSRRSNAAAEAAASAASEAARVLQARQQEARSTPKEEPKIEPEAPKDDGPRRQLPPRGNKVREQILEEIRSTRGEPKDEPKAEEPVEAPKEESKPEVKAEEPKQEEVVEESKIEAPKTIKVKVDGEEFEVPKDEVDEAGGVRSYQIQRASENRLKAANEALAEVRRAQAEALKAQTPAKPQPSISELIAAKADEIRFGTPEQMAAALQDILEKSAPPKVDPGSITEQVRNQIKHDSAVEAFDREFQDVVTNPVRLKAVVALRNERIGKINGPVDWNSFYRTIGNEVRSAFGGQPQSAQASPQTAGTPSQSPSDKEARKASITNLPTAAARAELPKEDKPETREESLNRMRKARGLPVH